MGEIEFDPEDGKVNTILVGHSVADGSFVLLKLEMEKHGTVIAAFTPADAVRTANWLIEHAGLAKAIKNTITM